VQFGVMKSTVGNIKKTGAQYWRLGKKTA
jgi:hypothetical protein